MGTSKQGKIYAASLTDGDCQDLSKSQLPCRSQRKEKGCRTHHGMKQKTFATAEGKPSGRYVFAGQPAPLPYAIYFFYGNTDAETPNAQRGQTSLRKINEILP